MPVPSEEGLRFEAVKRRFLNVCDQAKQDPEEAYVVILDEFNRADISKVFGETLFGTSMIEVGFSS